MLIDLLRWNVAPMATAEPGDEPTVKDWTASS